jgi:hypothetical protein
MKKKYVQFTYSARVQNRGWCCARNSHPPTRMVRPPPDFPEAAARTLHVSRGTAHTPRRTSRSLHSHATPPITFPREAFINLPVRPAAKRWPPPGGNQRRLKAWPLAADSAASPPLASPRLACVQVTARSFLASLQVSVV